MIPKLFLPFSVFTMLCVPAKLGNGDAREFQAFLVNTSKFFPKVHGGEMSFCIWSGLITFRSSILTFRSNFVKEKLHGEEYVIMDISTFFQGLAQSSYKINIHIIRPLT